ESAEAFDAFLDTYTARFNPTDEVELALVEEMIASSWRLWRAWVIEKQLFESALESPSTDTRLADLANAFGHLANSPETRSPASLRDSPPPHVSAFLAQPGHCEKRLHSKRTQNPIVCNTAPTPCTLPARSR